MQFKKWLEDIGSQQFEPGMHGGPEYASAGPVSGITGGQGGFDQYGNQIRLPRKKKKLPPLGQLGSKNLPNPLPPLDRFEKDHL